MFNGKDMTTYLMVGLIKKTLYKMSQCFPPYRSFKERVKVELDLSSYVDVSSFALKSDLASLKTDRC